MVVGLFWDQGFSSACENGSLQGSNRDVYWRSRVRGAHDSRPGGRCIDESWKKASVELSALGSYVTARTEVRLKIKAWTAAAFMQDCIRQAEADAQATSWSATLIRALRRPIYRPLCSEGNASR